MHPIFMMHVFILIYVFFICLFIMHTRKNQHRRHFMADISSNAPSYVAYSHSNTSDTEGLIETWG